MLLQLNIQNFAIVRSLDIDWQQGMTTITGETGAGKSIAIDALGLCLGERATTNVVRPGAKKTELAATFDIKHNSAAINWLENQDLLLEDECILRRVISAEGRSKAYINGSQVPLAQLKDLGQWLINIHGQHDHQLITKATEQRRIIDDFANHDDLLSQVKYYYQQWQSLTKELATLQESKTQREAKQQLLAYQVSELDEFSLLEGEFEQLEKEYKRHSNAQDLITETKQTLHLLAEEDQVNVVDALSRSYEMLNRLAAVDNQLSNVATLVNDALIQTEEAVTDLRHYHDRLELDPEAFSDIEGRYSLALQLAKKHNVAPQDLPQFHLSLSQELKAISSDEHKLIQLNDDIAQCSEHYTEAAKKLSASRSKAAKKVSEQVTKSMKALNMEHGQFSVEVEQSHQDKIASQGIDEVAFKVSLNPGQALEAMNKVASGGELSRISLAIQVILADKIITPTLIFDEVDVGISGPTAAMVGAKLQELAKNTQVICVTHLPQVASKGHQQFFVAKLTDGEQTETTVTELSTQSRVKEIARLLAGDSITEHSLANAQELLAS